MIKIKNLVNDNNNATANQFVIEGNGCCYFQSYDSVVVKINRSGKVILGRHWNYSRTTAKYVYTFLRDYTRYDIHSKKDVERYLKDKRFVYDDKLC